ncbi:MAG: SDR family NAD(P)-dependent oxidoreductase [Candidatus Dormibacteraeota bacterium]|nr:SDR family NAD(P)-dependent oxidoreductase [Candidatus Dormibacteraeota bacterium]
MTITLITGGARGLGREAARRLIAAGHTVYIGARDPGRGQQVAVELGAHLLVLDVSDDASVDAAARRLQQEASHLDVLVNNAAIAGPRKPPNEMTAADVRGVYETNVFGVIRVTGAFLPLLQAAPAPVVVNVSSGLGSLARTTDPSRFESSGPFLAYASSKAAVNMLTVQYAKAFPAVRFNVVDPGYTATDLNRHRGTQTVTEGTDAIVRMATLGANSPTATFVDAKGRVPW